MPWDELDDDPPGVFCEICGTRMIRDSDGGPDGADYHSYFYDTCENPFCEADPWKDLLNY